MKRKFATLDVFTRRRFEGNPLAVVFDSSGLDTAAMQAIAREFGHPETVFVLPPDDAASRARLRIFTPASELPFAGHPTVGAAVAFARLDAGDGDQSFVLEENIGPVSCLAMMHDGRCGYARFDIPKLPAQAAGAPDAGDAVAVLGLTRDDLADVAAPVSRWEAGVALTFVALRSRAATDRVRLDPARFEAVFGIGGPGMAYVYTEETVHPGHQLHARMFAPARGIAEDPATGSAAAAFAGLYVAARRPKDGAHRVMIEQGFAMGRPSLIELVLTIKSGALTKASIGGDAVVVTEGELDL